MVASVLKRRDTGFLLSAGGEPEDCGRGQRPGGRLRLACQADFGPVVAFTAPGAVPLNLVNFVAPAVCDFSIGPRPKVCPMIAACRRPGTPAGAALWPWRRTPKPPEGARQFEPCVERYHPLQPPQRWNSWLIRVVNRKR